MSALSKRDAMKLVADIRSAHIAGHTIAARTRGGHDAAMAGFLGGLEAVLGNFLCMQGCAEAAAALQSAMNDAPTDAEVSARNAQIDSYRAKATGSTSHG